MNDERPDWLDKHLATLPREINPGRDLWPEIAERVRRPSRSWVPAAAIAASVILGVGAMWTALRVQSPVPGQTVAVAPETTPQESVQRESVPEMMTASFGPARARYSQDWPRIREEIGPETAAVIEHNLDIIRRANADLSLALERQPDNPALRRLLRQTLAKELDVYQRAWDASRHTASTNPEPGAGNFRGSLL